MKRSLLFKLLLCYIISVSLIFMLCNTLGNPILKNYLTSNYFNQLQVTGNNMTDSQVVSDFLKLYSSDNASNKTESDKNDKDKKNKDTKKDISESINKTNVESLTSYIKSISQATNFSVWILDADGKFLYNSDGTTQKDDNILNYNKRFFYINTNIKNTVKDLVATPSIFCINKVTEGESTIGYLVLHTPANHIDDQLSNIITIMNMGLIICSIIIGIIFILIYFLTIYPINKITNYAIAASQGKLNQKVNIKSNDEYRDLSNAIFYLTSELNNIDEYQRKFISNISHDFRSPLTSIKGYLEAMLDGTIPPENYEKYIKTILFEADRLTGLTTNLLTLNNLDNAKQILHKTDFDINYIIKKTTDVYEGRCNKNKIKLETNFESDTQLVYADQAKIQQVINNLLDNAIKFSPHNSTITLSTYIKVEKVFISIKDHGQGISKDHLSHIWERFYKIDTSRGKDKKGTGLGLSITKEIINAHRENINVTSTEGVGTEFCFSLPKSKKTT